GRRTCPPSSPRTGRGPARPTLAGVRAEGAQEGEERAGDPTPSTLRTTTDPVRTSPSTPLPRHAASGPDLWARLQALVRRPHLPDTHAGTAGVRAALEDRLLPPAPGSRLWGWIGALLVTAVAGVLRLVHLE